MRQRRSFREFRIRNLAAPKGDQPLRPAHLVAIALPDRPLNERVRVAKILKVRGEGATLKVSLDGSAVALERLESCFEKNSRAGVESNPMSRRVAPRARAARIAPWPQRRCGRGLVPSAGINTVHTR
jgi:hypothetical protein